MQSEPGFVEFWDSQVEVLLTLAAAQLEIGLSVIADSVFMNTDRHHAQQLAERYGARYRPIYAYVSDDQVWEERVTKRYAELNNPAVATWEQLQHQRQHFRKWDPNTALFIDAVNSAEQNYAKVLRFVTSEDIWLQPLEEVPRVRGRYHE